MNEPLPFSETQSEQCMRQALARARDGIAAGQSPFAALIYELRGGRTLAVEHNRVWAAGDPTAHAEITTIRKAAETHGIDFSGCWMWSTCEPCPMCMAAIHWARFDGVVYGAAIADATEAGFNELTLPAKTLLELGHSRVRLVPAVLAVECRRLFQDWQGAGKSASY